MIFWLITVGEPLPTEPDDVRLLRTGLLAKNLAERGHQVEWWTSSVNHFKKSHHVEANAVVDCGPGLRVRFLHGPLYHKNISLRRFINHIAIARIFRRLSRQQQRPDLILCSLPPLELCDEASRFGREHGVPTFLDVRDLWPDEFEAALPARFRSLGRWLFWPMRQMASRSLRNASGIIAVSQRYLEWGLALAGRDRRPQDRVFTHGYPTPGELPGPDAQDRDRLSAIGISPDRKIFWFVGTFVGSIDLSTVIAAARQLAGRPDIQFVITGSGQDDGRYRKQAEGLPNVTFTGWLNRQDIQLIARHAYAGLGAYKAGALMSLTNKIFEYLSAGVPVLLSLPGEAEQIIVGNGCGLSYEPGAPSSLSTAVRTLADDVPRRDEMAKKAKELFLAKYSSDRIYAEMCDFLEQQARLPGDLAN